MHSVELWSTLLQSYHNYSCSLFIHIQYIPRNMHTVFALLCFVVVIHWLIFPYPSGLLHWHCGNLTITPVPAKQPWWIWINTLCKFIMNECITTLKQSTTKPCAYFMGYTVLQCCFTRTRPMDKRMIAPLSVIYYHELTLIPACIINHMYRKVREKLLIHSQTSTPAPLKFGNGLVI